MILYQFRKRKSVIRYAMECDSCGKSFERDKRVYTAAINPELCRCCSRQKIRDENAASNTIKANKTPVKKACPNCGNPCRIQSKRCKKCSDIFRDTAKVAYDLSSKLPYTPIRYCPHCGKVLKKNISRMCNPCHNIRQDRGKSKERSKFNASRKWNLVRKSVIERDDFTCQICLVRGSSVLNVHHLLSYTHFPSHRLDIHNLITLCESCHRKVHFGKDVDLKMKYIQDYFYL